MNTASAPSVIDIVNKIPISLYFAEIPDRQQVLKYIDYLYNNVPASRQVDTDKLLREVISRELRMVTMKIIEPEILLVVALDKVSLADLSLPSGNLIRKVISQNPDKYDLDIMQRVMSQIMTKLPRDLRDKVAGKHKLQVFQLVARQLNIEPKLLEKFATYDPSNSTPITMEFDKGDYNTLNQKYLQELYAYQQKQPYISANNLEYGALAADIALSQPTGQATATSGLFPQVMKAQYIDQAPDMMLGAKDNKLYYFDSSSGTLSDFPVSGANQTPVSIQDMKTILASQKINESQIQNAINSIKNKVPITTAPPLATNITIPESYFTQIENYFKELIFGADATETTQANIPTQPTPTNTEYNGPVPPAFLQKLYKLKRGYQSESQNQQGDGYNQMMYGIGGSDISMSGGNMSPSNNSTSSAASYSGQYDYNNWRSNMSTVNRPQYIPTGSIFNSTGYTGNNARPVFNVTNPQTTTTSTATPTTTSMDTSKATSDPTITQEENSKANIFGLENSNSATVSSSSSDKTNFGFANIAANSQEIVNTIAQDKVNAKIKNDNKNVEKIAIGFITVLILIFLIAVIFYAKNNS